MKKWMFFIFTLTACYLSACKPNFDADIEAIKKSPVPTNLLVSAFFAEVPNLGANTIEAGIAQLAGVAGSAKWEASRPEKYKDNQDVVSVQVEVKSVSDKGNHTVKFQWLLNRKSKQNELVGFEVDGKKQSMIDAVMALKLGVISQEGNETPQPKGDEPSNAPLAPKGGVMSCKDLQSDDSKWQEKLDLIAKNTNMKSATRYMSDFVYSLCEGNKSDADKVVMYGWIQSDDAVNVARVLGIAYKPPQRDAKSMLYEMTYKQLAEFMGTAPGSNAASYFVENPDSDLGKLIKKALDGDKSARKQLTDMDWSSGPPKKK